MYVIDQVVYLIIANRTMLYDVDGTVEESVADQGLIGFSSFDFDYNYLGCNEAARRFLPVFSGLRVDEPLKDTGDDAVLLSWLKAFKSDESDFVHIRLKERNVTGLQSDICAMGKSVWDTI